MNENIDASYEGLVIGVDEVGRGAWAGPVVACAFAFYSNKYSKEDLESIDDSKKIPKNKRKKIYDIVTKMGLYDVAFVSNIVVDKINVLQATLLAMEISINRLMKRIYYKENILKEKSFNDKRLKEVVKNNKKIVLIDGLHVPDVSYNCKAIKKGDSKSLSIAAASIIAKIYRDDFMNKLSLKYQSYMWSNNVGYGTRDHKLAIEKYGITKLHRKSFKPIKKYI